MNTFGRLFRVSIFGESHGREVGVLLDGCPAGIPLAEDDFIPDLGRRKPGRPGTTARQEPDVPLVKSGIFNGKTTGSPILVAFENRDIRSEDYADLRDRPRPGHADFVARRKFGGFHDPRGGGHFSGRLTLGLVAAGVVAKKLIRPAAVDCALLEAGGSPDVDDAVRAALKEGDSVGGLLECGVQKLPAGLGEPFFDSVESLISHAVFSIPGVKGIAFGSGFACARLRGSQANDVLVDGTGKTETNHAGGVNGGISNGNPLVFRVAVKPTPSIAQKQRTVDLRTNAAAEISSPGRHDACIALRLPVIVEAAAAIVLADLLLLEQGITRIQGATDETGKDPHEDRRHRP